MCVSYFLKNINSVPTGGPDYLESQLKPREIPFLQTGLSPFPWGFQLIGFPGREDGHLGYGCLEPSIPGLLLPLPGPWPGQKPKGI